MSFQWIIDRAEAISVNRKKTVASTTARDGTTRAVSRGAQTWRFDVKLPDGLKWTDIRQFITQAELLDRTTPINIQFNNPGQNWFLKYQGDSSNYTGFVANITQNSSSITLTSWASTSGYFFRKGDVIQLGTSGKVYTVTSDVPTTSTTVPLHRPVIEATASSVALRVADNCLFNVLCVQFPDWTIFARDQVSWSGSFVFVENLV